jgi:hypothetical protein
MQIPWSYDFVELNRAMQTNGAASPLTTAPTIETTNGIEAGHLARDTVLRSAAIAQLDKNNRVAHRNSKPLGGRSLNVDLTIGKPHEKEKKNTKSGTERTTRGCRAIEANALRRS